MISIQEVTLFNFMNIESLCLKFDQDTTVAIVGENGNGKSTLFTAIAFCLTGYKKGETYKEYIRLGEEEARVILDAAICGEPIHYDIKIAMSGITKNVTFKGQTYVNSAYKQIIDEYKLDLIQDVMFMFQGKKTLIEATPLERSNMLKELFQFDFSDIVDSFINTQATETSVMNMLEGELNILEKEVFKPKSFLREVSPSTIEAWEEEEKNLNIRIDALSKIDSSVASKLASDIRGLKTTISDLESKLSKYKSSIRSFESSYGDYDVELNTSLKATAEENLEKYQRELEDNEIKLDEARREESKLISEKSVAEHRYSIALKHLKVGKTGVCPECGNVVDDEHLKQMQDEFDSAEEELKNIKSKLLDVKTSEIQAERNAILSKINKASNDIKFYENDLATFNATKDKHELNITAANQTEEMIESNRSILDAKIEDFNKYSDLIEQVKTKPELSNKLKETKDNLERARSARIINQETRAYNEGIETKIAENEENKRITVCKINDSAKRIKDLTTCANIFKKSFPSYIVLQACQNIEAYINEVVQRAFPSLHVKLLQNKSGVGFFYNTDGEDHWLNIAMASGAQGQILQIANQIALAKMYNLQCIFLDEIDASCSKKNSSIVFDFIASLSDFEQIFFISHMDESLNTVRSKKDNFTMYEVEEGMYTEIN